MQDFDYIAAKSIEELVSLLSSEENQVRIMSGGTDLLAQLREGRRAAKRVVDVKKIPELNDLVYDPAAGLRLGAAVSCQRFCQDKLVAAAYPGLVDGISLIGGTQIQGRASVGGNLCNASPAADSIPPLIVHSAICEIVGPGGKRELPVKDFCIGPGRNALQPGEFLAALRIPPVSGPGQQSSSAFGARYLRFIPRNEMDIAVVGAGAAVRLSPDGSVFQWACLALGAVAPVPLVVEEAARFLEGQPVSPETIRQAALIAQEAARPISDMRGTVAQRRHLAGVLSRRALEGAVERARNSYSALSL